MSQKIKEFLEYRRQMRLDQKQSKSIIAPIRTTQAGENVSKRERNFQTCQVLGKIYPILKSCAYLTVL